MLKPGGLFLRGINPLSLTPKQEEFAQQWYATGNKTEAYRRAYNCAGMSESTINKRASELSLDGEITGRFAELQKVGQEETKTTVRDLDAMLKDAVELAKSISNPSAIVSAVTALAKLHGLNAPDKVERVDDNRTTDVTIRIVDAS